MSHSKKILYIFILTIMVFSVYGLSTSTVGNIKINGIINQTNSSLISTFEGNVTVQAISGDGSGLTGITAEANVTAGTGINVTGSIVSIYGPYRLPQSCTNNYISKYNSTGNLWYCSQSDSGSGTVTNVTAGSGMSFSDITSSGTVTMGTPGTLSTSSINQATGTTHTHSVGGFITTSDPVLPLAWGGGSLTLGYDNIYLNLVGSELTFNETKLNSTIDGRDTDTTYTAGTGLILTSTTFSLLWQSLSNFTNDLTDLDSTNIANLNWTKLQNHPASCSGGGSTQTYVTTNGDSNTCTGISNLGDTNINSITSSVISDIQNFNETSRIDSLNTTKYDKTGGEITGNVNITQNLTVSGSTMYNNGTHIIWD